MKHVFLAAMLFAPGLFAGTPLATAKQFTTQGMLNGRSWMTFDTVAKEAYLAGFADGCQGSPNKNFPHFAASKLTVQEFAARLNAFYSDAANANLPIALAAELVAIGTGGESPAQYKRDVEAVRNWINSGAK